MKKIFKEYYAFIFTIILFVIWIGSLTFFDYKAKKLREHKEEYIQELEEKVESYEKELTDIALNEGLLDDIKLEIQIKQNELLELNTQIAEKKQELEEVK